MKSNALLTISLSLAALLVQAGCSAESAATEGVRRSGTTGGARTATNQPSAPSTTVVLPEGTVLVVRTTSTLSTKTQESGQTFSASLQQPLMLGGREIAPKGADVEGRIVDADEGGRVKGVASLTVGLTGLEVGGKSLDIATNTVTREAGTTKQEDATKVAIGSGVGAVIGAIAGGGKGAAIGAAAGGGAGTGVVLATRGDPAVIPSESVLTFALRAPLTITRK
jgi:hypothetical protein